MLPWLDAAFLENRSQGEKLGQPKIPGSELSTFADLLLELRVCSLCKDSVRSVQLPAHGAHRAQPCPPSLPLLPDGQQSPNPSPPCLLCPLDEKRLNFSTGLCTLVSSGRRHSASLIPVPFA